jgi:radical SAM-linked protein
VGVTSEAELMDIFMTKPSSPHWLINKVSQQLPSGLEIQEVYQLPPAMPSLQSQVSFAEYKVTVETEKQSEEIAPALSHLLSLKHLPWHHERDTGRRDYDLRVLIDDLWLIGYCSPYGIIGMRLRCDSRGTGRPEQVAHALGFTQYPQSIHRTRLILKNQR